jgi:hypothetical protein
VPKRTQGREASRAEKQLTEVSRVFAATPLLFAEGRWSKRKKGKEKKRRRRMKCETRFFRKKKFEKKKKKKKTKKKN